MMIIPTKSKDESKYILSALAHKMEEIHLSLCKMSKVRVELILNG